MADYDNFQNFNNYQINLDDNIQMRKAIAKMEDLITRKQVDFDNIMKLYEDMKLVNEKIRKEIKELNQKLTQSYSEKSNTEKKYDAEIQKLKNYYERQKEVYEQQIAKLSFQDSESMKNKLVIEIDLKYQSVLKEKEMELDNLSDQIFDSKKKYELLLAESETTKGELLREIDQIKENYKSEIKEYNFKIQLMNEKNEMNNEKENLRNLKNELEISRKNTSDLQNELFNLRKEKENLIKEKYEINLNCNKDLEKLKLDIAVKTSEYERIYNSYKLIEGENINLRNKFDSKNDEIKNLIEEKLNLVQSSFIKENLIQSLKSENLSLKKKYDERDFECTQLEKISMEKEKNAFIKEKKDREEFTNKIDELTKKLRESQIDYKNYVENSKIQNENLKNDLNQALDEKKFLISKFGNMDKNKDSGNKNTTNEGKNLDKVVTELNLQIIQQNKQIERLQNQISWYKKNTGIVIDDFDEFTSDGYVEKNKSSTNNEHALNQIIRELKQKITFLTEKKNHYKSKCKIANEKLKSVLDKFNQAEKLDENSKKMSNIDQKINNINFESNNKDKNPIEEEYNDFEENISIGSNNWK